MKTSGAKIDCNRRMVTERGRKNGCLLAGLPHKLVLLYCAYKNHDFQWKLKCKFQTHFKCTYLLSILEMILKSEKWEMIKSECTV